MNERVRRVKDALRRGHVAALRGRLEARRPTRRPRCARGRCRTSAGGVLRRLGQPDEALAAFAGARAGPADEAAFAVARDVQARPARRPTRPRRSTAGGVLEARAGWPTPATSRAAPSSWPNRRSAERRSRRSSRGSADVRRPGGGRGARAALSVLEVDPMAAPGRPPAADGDATRPTRRRRRPRRRALAARRPRTRCALAVEAAIDAGDLDEARGRPCWPPPAIGRSASSTPRSTPATRRWRSRRPIRRSISPSPSSTSIAAGGPSPRTSSSLLGRLVRLTGDNADPGQARADLAADHASPTTPRLAEICA